MENTQSEVKNKSQNNIQPVNKQLLNTLPYSAVVKIVSKFQNGELFREGSGFLIQINGEIGVLTAARLVCRIIQKGTGDWMTERARAENVSVFVQTKDGLKKVKVKRFKIPEDYEYPRNIKDMGDYDMSYLFLYQNDIVSKNQILKVEINFRQLKIKIQVIGFSSILDNDKEKNNQQNTCYHLKDSRIINVYDRSIAYDQKAERGFSGAPVVIRKNGEPKVIGIHQGSSHHFSQAILLTSYTKSTAEILKMISNLKIQEQNDYSYNIFGQKKEYDYCIQPNKILKQQMNYGWKFNYNSLACLARCEFNYNSLQDKVELQFGKAPDYRTVCKGLTLLAICQTDSCQAFNKQVCIVKGFGTFHIGKEIYNCICPSCKKPTIQSNNLGFYKTQVKVQGRQKDGKQVNQEYSVSNDKFTSFNNSDDDIRIWNYLEITTKPLRK